MLMSNRDPRSKKKTDCLFRSLEDLRESTLGRVIRAVASVIAFNGDNDDDDETKLDDEDTVAIFLKERLSCTSNTAFQIQFETVERNDLAVHASDV